MPFNTHVATHDVGPIQTSYRVVTVLPNMTGQGSYIAATAAEEATHLRCEKGVLSVMRISEASHMRPVQGLLEASSKGAKLRLNITEY